MTDPAEPFRFTIGFVIGTGRCGSSLVQEVLARHPEVGFVSNIEDRIPMGGIGVALNNPVYRSVPPAFSKKGRVRYAPSEGYRALAREVSPLVVAPFRDLTAEDVTPWLERRFRDFFTRRAMAQNRPVFLHKFTGWSRVGFIQRVFPEARFVHVVRDGRAVASSFLQTSWWEGFSGPEAWGWGPLPEPYRAEWEESNGSFVVLAGLHWKMLIDGLETASKLVDEPRWLQVRYEDFVADPPGRLGEMLEFLGLKWDPAFEAQVAKHTFDRSRLNAYRDDLTPEQIELLDSSLAKHLERYDYLVP